MTVRTEEHPTTAPTEVAAADTNETARSSVRDNPLPPPAPERRGYHGRPARHLWRRYSLRSMRGVITIGLILAVSVLAVVSGAAMSYYAETMVSQMNEHRDAAMMRKLKTYVDMWVQENYGYLVEQTSTAPVELPMEDIKHRFANPWIRDTTHLGGKMRSFVKQMPFGPDGTPWLWVYMIPDGGLPYAKNRQGMAARNTGALAWFTRDSEPGVGVGIWSKWKALINSDLAPLGVTVPTGVVGLYYPFAPGDTAFDYLHRYAVPGQPWLNAMNQDLDMNNNDIINIRSGDINYLVFNEIHATHGQPCTPFQYTQTDGSQQYGARTARSDADGNVAMCVFEEDIGQWYWRNIGLMPNCTPDQLITADATNFRCAPNPYYRVPVNVQYSACNACTNGVQNLISWQCLRLPDNKLMDVNSAKCQAIKPAQTLACNNPGLCTPPPPPPPPTAQSCPLGQVSNYTLPDGSGGTCTWTDYFDDGTGRAAQQCQCISNGNQVIASGTPSGDQNGGGNNSGVGAAGNGPGGSNSTGADGENTGNPGASDDGSNGVGGQGDTNGGGSGADSGSDGSAP